MRRCQRGAVTAELALGIPVLVSLTIGLVWLLTIAVAQLRMVDAARETARSAARGDPRAEAVSRGLAVAPGAEVVVLTTRGQVVASVSDSVAPPGGLLSFLPGVRVHARAVTATEGDP